MKIQPKVSSKVITPELAKKYLQSNEGNRPLNEKNVNFFYQQMATGQWKLTGDTIKLSEKGKLLDGQHRLKALVKYGKPLEMFICSGLNDDVFKVLDTGKNRSAADILAIKGYKNQNELSGAIKAILLFESGVYSSANGVSKNSKVSNTNILDFIEKNPEIEEVISHTSGIYRQFRYISNSQLAMLYWVISKKNQSKCDDFFSKYSTGIDLSETSPIRLLRDKFIRDSQNRTKLTGRDKMALFIYAWNAFAMNKKIERLTLTKDYNFPKPV